MARAASRNRAQAAAEGTLPRAHIAHASPARTRLSFPDLKGQPEALEAVCAAARKLAGVHEADGRPLTGSVIITHDGSAEDLARAARKARAFEVREMPQPPAIAPGAEVLAWKDWADQSLRETLGPGIDVRTIAAAAFLAMAVRQLAAGSIMPPAATALWYGVSLLLAAGPEPGAPTADGDGA